jgi:hypothetical protein
MQTFVVRLFRSEHEGPVEDRILRGIVDDIGAGSRTAFSDAAQLLRILGQAALPSSRPAEGASPGSTCAETDRPTTHSQGGFHETFT